MSLHYDPTNIQSQLYNRNLKSEKVVVMTGIIERAKIDQRQEIIHLQEKLQQLSVQMNEVNRSVDESIVKIQEELKQTISQLDKKLQQDIGKMKDDYVSKTALKKVTGN